MGKKSKSSSQSEKKTTEQKSASSLPFLSGNTGAAIDPTLASLFEQSAGPVKAPVILPAVQAEKKDVDGADDEDEDMQEAPGEDSDVSAAEEVASEAPSRKRKRANADDLEGSYMRRIEKEEEREAEKRQRAKKAKQAEEKEQMDEEDESENDDAEEDASSDDETTPVHESQAAGKKTESSELDKSNRTVFLGNISTQAITSKSAKKTLLKHLASFCATLPESSGPHKVESIRFRSTAFSSGGRVPKRAAFARKEVLDDTTPSTNAYAVYSTIQAARKASTALNGTVVLDRHMRVDSVAHPSEIDHKRCVFVGNLDFVDHEVPADDDDEKMKKKKNNRPSADVEEGLWRTFNGHVGKHAEKKSAAKGSVESVRVVRDNLTRVGKGFAYVQFYDANCVEEALLLNEKKFPPMLPRKLRVSRAKKVMKKREGPAPNAKDRAMGDSHRTLQGRATKLFGRAGAAKLKASENRSISQNSMVFEGQRATEGGHTIKVKTKSRGSKGKPKNRSSQRAAAYRAAGGRQGKMAKKSD